MRSKLLGYILAVLGLIVLVLGLAPVYNSFTKTIIVLSFLSANNLLIIGGALVVIGLVFSRFGRRGKQAHEVPIYHGKYVIGFRRMGK